MGIAPRLLKGAIIAIDSDNPLLSSVTVFQYNPHTLTRRLEPQMGGESRAEPLRIKGAPVETIDVEIDASD